MRKVIVEIDEKMFDNFHNAVASYLDVLNACMLGCEVPSKFRKFESLSEEELKKKRANILEMYRQIEKQMHD